MQKKTRTLLEELNALADQKNREHELEARATHIINSAINLLKLMQEMFDPDTAYELERRFVNSIRGADPNKFVRAVRKLQENAELKQNLTIIDGDLKKDPD